MQATGAQGMTDRYRIIDTPWPSDRKLLSSDGHDERGKALVAVDQYSAIEFRDEAGKVFHQYRFSQNPYFYLMRHYLAYLSQSYEHLFPDTLKAQFLRSCLFCLRKLAAHRRSASVLEIGGTIGENYWMLSEMIGDQGLDLTLDFVGIEIDRNAVQFSREIFQDDPNFEMLTGDASDLSVFPDACFDLVLANSTNNFLADPVLGLREALRVSRVGALLHLFVNSSGGSRRLTHGVTGHTNYVFSRQELRDMLDELGTWHVYNLTRYRKYDATILSTRGDGYFMEDLGDDKIFLDHLVIARYPIFPELAFLEDPLDGPVA
jgi:ubiquinone/menaquinone biosynthesis C-methylase UbiE